MLSCNFLRFFSACCSFGIWYAVYSLNCGYFPIFVQVGQKGTMNVFRFFLSTGLNFWKLEDVLWKKRSLSLKMICNGMSRINVKVVYPKEEMIKSLGGFLRSCISYRAAKILIGLGDSVLHWITTFNTQMFAKSTPSTSSTGPGGAAEKVWSHPQSKSYNHLHGKTCQRGRSLEVLSLKASLVRWTKHICFAVLLRQVDLSLPLLTSSHLYFHRQLCLPLYGWWSLGRTDCCVWLLMAWGGTGRVLRSAA